jgi:hypothetical protein
MTGGTAHKLEWALMPALQLAEGGKTVKERRIGMCPLIKCLYNLVAVERDATGREEKMGERGAMSDC